MYLKHNIHIILIGIMLFTSGFSFGQNNNSEIWTEQDKAQYKILKNLAYYVYKKDKSEISRDTLFSKYIFFDYIITDTTRTKEYLIFAFDSLFTYFQKTVDSIGVDNLDAKPVRFYKNHKIYKPFDEEQCIQRELGTGKKMYVSDDNVFAYYRKDDPENPLGVVVMESISNRLLAWILLNKSDRFYFFVHFKLFGNYT